MRVLITHISLIVASILLYVFRLETFYIPCIIMLSFTLLLFIINILAMDGNKITSGSIYMCLTKMKRVYSKYGVFYIILKKDKKVVLLKDCIFTFKVITYFYFTNMESAIRAIDRELDSKFNKESDPVSLAIKEWDGYTSSMNRRDAKIDEIVN